MFEGRGGRKPKHLVDFGVRSFNFEQFFFEFNKHYPGEHNKEQAEDV